MTTGVTIDQPRRLWRALGFPERGRRGGVHQGRRRGALATLAADRRRAASSTSTRAVELTRAVGQTMARLADWEVATLVHRRRGARGRRRRHRQPTGHGAAPGRADQRALRGAADLRLAPAPGRRGRRGSRRSARTTRTCTPPQVDRRVRRPGQLHRAVQPARRGPDRRPRRGLRVPQLRRGRRARRPGDQDARRLGAVRGRPTRSGACDIAADIVDVIGGDDRLPDVRVGLATGSGRAADGRRLRPAGQPGRPADRRRPAQPGDHRRRDRRAAAARTSSRPGCCRPGRCAGSASSSRSPYAAH